MNASDYIVITAFILGLFGSVHCAAMCSGVAGYLQRSVRIDGHSPMTCAVAFNVGRLLSYAIAGAIAAVAGTTVVKAIGMDVAHTVMQIGIGMFLILIGLNIAGWWNGLGWVERSGGRFWRLLSPLSKRVFPISSIPRAILAGALWGWLPCGLVYSALVLVMGSQSVLIGVVSMLAFGLGTLPVLLGAGIAAQKINLTGKPLMRQSAGALVMVFGFMVFTGLVMTGSGHH